MLSEPIKTIGVPCLYVLMYDKTSVHRYPQPLFSCANWSSSSHVMLRLRRRTPCLAQGSREKDLGVLREKCLLYSCRMTRLKSFSSSLGSVPGEQEPANPSAHLEEKGKSTIMAAFMVSNGVNSKGRSHILFGGMMLAWARCRHCKYVFNFPNCLLSQKPRFFHTFPFIRNPRVYSSTIWHDLFR